MTTQSKEKLKETLEHPPVLCSELAIHKGMLPTLWLADVKQLSELCDPEKCKKILIISPTFFSLRDKDLLAYYLIYHSSLDS